MLTLQKQKSSGKIIFAELSPMFEHLYYALI